MGSLGGGFRIKANNVVVSGFTHTRIKGSDFGVEVEDSANVILEDNTLTDCACTASKQNSI